MSPLHKLLSDQIAAMKLPGYRYRRRNWCAVGRSRTSYGPGDILFTEWRFVVWMFGHELKVKCGDSFK